MGGRADQIYGRCTRLGMGMRGSGGAQMYIKERRSLRSKGLFHSESLGKHPRPGADGGEYVCRVAIIITGEGYSRTTEPKKIVEQKKDKQYGDGVG